MTLWPCLCDLVTILLFRSLFICRGLYLYTLLTRENLFNFYPCKQLKFEKLLSWIPIWFLGASVYLPYFNAAGYPGCCVQRALLMFDASFALFPSGPCRNLFSVIAYTEYCWTEFLRTLIVMRYALCWLKCKSRFYRSPNEWKKKYISCSIWK